MATLKLQDKIAMVTGGGSGIGRATCQLFADSGANVVVLDMNSSSMEDTLTTLSRQHGNNHCAVKCDVTNAEEVNTAFKKVEDAFGRKCSILVNSAGISMQYTLADDIAKQDIDRIIDVNLKGTMLIAKGFIRALKDSKDQDSGVIVNIVSLNGKMAVPGSGAYCASKFGVIGVTKTIATEFPIHKVRCNAVLPGFIDTPLLPDVNSDFIGKLVKDIPLGRIGKPGEVASACLFLVSDDSSYVNGATLDISGGLYA